MLKVAWTDTYVLPLPPNHHFPMSKYEVLPQQLLYEGTLKSENIFNPTPISEHWILKTHHLEYWNNLNSLSLLPKEIRRTGFPLTPELIQREITIMQGTVDCTIYALQHGVAMNIAGGTHHAFTDRGEGFCLLNDIAIAANYLLDNNLAKKILVVDLDVHQGNGTAEIFRHDPRVFTFSMHGANNYPLHKETSDLDIGLADHTDDSFYLKTLASNLNNLFDSVQPDFIFFQSGVDVLATDKLGKLGLTREGCKLRDRMVLTMAKQNKIPLVASMGGGYSVDFRDIIEAHANTYRLAQEIFFLTLAMPFTAAHPAIILLFARVKIIPLSALVIGSLTPDFEYFIKMKLTGRYGHTLEGMFLMDLPIAFILWLIFHQVIKVPLIKNLPHYFKSRLITLKKFEFIAHMKTNFLYVLIGLLIGIFSHIVWDSFIHEKEVFVLQWEWLSQPLFTDYPGFPTFRMLQHVSTLLGSIFIGWYFHRLPEQPCKVNIRLSFWVIFVAVALITFSIRAWFTFEYFGDIVATVISASCIGIIFSSIFYRLRYE